MDKYIAFLRAINVGGHKSVKMTDIKQVFESLRLKNVQTYIQSGNVIFESKEIDSPLLEKKINGELEKLLGYKVETFVRTIQEVKAIAKKTPFTPKENETVHIVFLGEKPNKKTQQALMSLKSEADNFAIKGREIYNLRHDRENSVFSNNFIEKIIQTPGTTRNLTTINKIVEKYG